MASSTSSSSSSSVPLPTETSTVGNCGTIGGVVFVCPNATSLQFGPCCNVYGECASDPFSCSLIDGCQPAYGTCEFSAPSSSAAQSSTAMVGASNSTQSSSVMSSFMISSSSYSTTTIIQSTVVVSPSPSSSYSSTVILSSTVLVSPSPSSSSVLSTSGGSSSSNLMSSSSMSSSMNPSPSVSTSPVQSSSGSSGVSFQGMSSSSLILQTSSQMATSTPASSTVSSQSPTVIQSACTNLVTPIACPQSNESYYDNFVVECGINYSMGNMPGTGTYQPLTMELCIQNCSGTPGCAGVVWQTGPKYCYLKQTIGTRSSNTGVIGAYLPNPAAICVGGMVGGSSSSNLIGSTASVSSSSMMGSSTVVSTSSVVSSISSSVSSTATSAQSSSVSSTTSATSSGVSGCPTTPTYTDPSSGDVFNMEQGTGFSGGNLTVPVNVTNWPACASLCANSYGCRAAIWLSGSPVGLCYVKSAVGTPVARSNACGGIMPNATLAATSSLSTPPLQSTLTSSSQPSSSSVTTSSVLSSSSRLSSSTSSVSSSPSPAFNPSKGSKRGLVYISEPNGYNTYDDPVWVQGGSDLNWYYNYAYTPTPSYASYPQLQYVPMLWGDYNSTFTQTVISMIQMGVNVSHVMSFNEPDGTFSTGGSQVSPQRAAARWATDIAPLGAYGVQLGAPAVAGNEGGFQWLQQFFTYCNGSCNASFISVHWYGNFQGLASKLGQMGATYPNMTIWVTEFADAYDTLANTTTYTNQDFGYLDRLSNVIRYSYFGSMRSSVSNVGPNPAMLDQCGNLTQIGYTYLNLTGVGALPYSTTCSTSPSSASSSTSSSRASSNTVSASTTYSPTSFVQPSSIPNPTQQTSTPSPYLGPTTTTSTTSMSAQTHS